MKVILPGFFAKFRFVQSFGLDSSVDLGMPRNEQFLLWNYGNRYYTDTMTEQGILALLWLNRYTATQQEPDPDPFLVLLDPDPDSGSRKPINNTPRKYWIISIGKAFSRSFYMAPRPPPLPSPDCKLDRRHTERLRKRENLLTGEGWKGVAE